MKIKLETLKSIDGFLHANCELGDEAISLCTDSRVYNGENTFIALYGESFNGVSFFEELKQKGCNYLIATLTKENEQIVDGNEDNIIWVEDSVYYLQALARHISMEFQKEKSLICVCGSNGKTTTKNMMSFIINELGIKCFSTQKNNNNHIGVPLTLLQALNKNYDIGVIELGSNHKGEIEKLCSIVNPKIGFVTNIGYTHLEFFNSLDEVFDEEGYLLKWLESSDKTQFIFQNLYDSYLVKLDLENNVFKIGADVEIKVLDDKALITLDNHEYHLHNDKIIGEHNFFNLACSCIIVSQVLKIELSEVIAIASMFKPTSNRSEWKSFNGVQVFLDAYNANPSSMEVALRAFARRSDNNRSLYILGDMNELGTTSEFHHRSIGKLLSQLGAQNVWFVGKFAKQYMSGFGNKCECFDSVSLLRKEALKQFDRVFIKGSRSLQLESLLDIR